MKPTDATALFQELRKPLLRYLVCLGLTADESQDVVQEAFLRLQRHLRAGGATCQIRSWLFRVAHNEALNRQQRYERRFHSPLDDFAESVADPATPEMKLLKKEKSVRLVRAIRSLGKVEPECLLLRAEGLRYREIAEVMGIGCSTVADTLERALRKLAEECDV